MASTFQFGDLLLVVPDMLSQLHTGDVIVFCKSGFGDATRTIIVHRVTTLTIDGAITKGDSYDLLDAGVVTAGQLLGRVVRVQRGNKSYVVWGGFAGRLWMRYLHLRRRVLAFGRAPYRWLRASGFVRRLWRPPLARVTLATARGPVVKYLCGGKTVAIWQPETRDYWCRKPYDLVLDAPGPATNDQRINE